MSHGKTVKYCYTCGRNTSHDIVESDGLKAYICINQERHEIEARNRINDPKSNQTVSRLSSAHTGNCRYLHDDRM